MIARKMVLMLALSAVLPSGAAFAANTNAIIHYSGASSESFNSQIASSGPSLVASLQALYSRFINFSPVKSTPIPSLAADQTVSPDGKTYTFTLHQSVKFNSNKFFKPAYDFNASDVILPVLRQEDVDHPYRKTPQGSYEYFNDVSLGKLIKEVKKVDNFHAQFVLNEPNAVFPTGWGMDFASILPAEYADAMLKKGTPENVSNWSIGTGPYVLRRYEQDS